MTLGFRFGRIAYSTDVINLDDAAFAALEGVDVWIIDALGLKPHVTHANIDKSLSWIEKVRPQRAILTHMGVDLDYLTLSKSLPSGVEPAFDGMVINVA